MDSDATDSTEFSRREFIRRASAVAVAGLGAPYVWAQRNRRDAGRQQLRRRIPGALREGGHPAVREEVRRQGRARRHRHVVAGLRQDPRVEGRTRLRRRRGAEPARGGPGREGRTAREDHGQGSAEHQVHVGEGARRRCRPIAVMHTLQFDSLLYNKDKIDKPGSVGGLLAAREALRREGEGPPHQLQPGQPAVGVRADSRGRAGRRQRVEHGPGVGAAEEPEAVRGRRGHRRPPRPRRISRAAKSGCRPIGARALATTSAAAFRTA